VLHWDIIATLIDISATLIDISATLIDITATLIDITATLIDISATLQYIQTIGVEYKKYTPTLYMVNRWTSCMINIIYTYQSYLYKVYGYH
jgi:hypothetical protein